MRGKVLAWLEAFLSNRYQRVVLNGFYSQWTPVISGVPQGTILGPILFLYYINDLPGQVVSIAKLFADDCKLYHSVHTREDCITLQRDLDSLAAWSRAWLLKFSAEKCVVLRIRAALDFTYFLEGQPLTTVTEQKDLGIIISDDLKPSCHIDYICGKANQRLGLIKRCFTNKSPIVLSQLYRALVRPILETNSAAWNPWLIKDIDRLDKVQRRCERLCSQDLKLESLTDRRKRADMRETYKILHHKYKLNPDELFHQTGKPLHGHSKKLAKQQCRTDIRKQFFSNRVVSPWNDLPEEVVSAPSADTFKTRLELSSEG